MRKKNKRKVKKMKKWKVGDLVVMNDKYHVSEKNAGRVFEVRSEPTIIGGEECVFLTGFVGCYASDGLSEATRRQKTIYILQNLDDGRFETLVGKIEGYIEKREAHSDLLENDEWRKNLSIEDITKWYKNWDEENRKNELYESIELKFFYDLLMGRHAYLYNERVRGAQE